MFGSVQVRRAAHRSEGVTRGVGGKSQQRPSLGWFWLQNGGFRLGGTYKWLHSQFYNHD